MHVDDTFSSKMNSPLRTIIIMYVDDIVVIGNNSLRLVNYTDHQVGPLMCQEQNPLRELLPSGTTSYHHYPSKEPFVTGSIYFPPKSYLLQEIFISPTK